jgi:divalent metal cation (Fe/Co/Zn/Cd) transporter
MSDSQKPASTTEAATSGGGYFTIFDALFILAILLGILFGVIQGAKWYGWIGGLLGLVVGPGIGYIGFFIFVCFLALILKAVVGGKL